MRNNQELNKSVNDIGEIKGANSFQKLLVLSILAGCYIAFGAIFYTFVTSFGGHAGLIKLVGGLVFCLGLILVLVAGAELYTGNNLMVIALFNKRISLMSLIRNWTIVFFGNFLGSLIIVMIMFFTGFYLQDDFLVGKRALMIASSKVELSVLQLVMKAILCNILVCLAVWMSMASKSITGKILSILFPITAFVAVGFEHSVANMYFIPMGLMIKNFSISDFWTLSGLNISNFMHLNFIGFLKNLFFVTIGNTIGGVVFVAISYWFINKNESS